MNYGVNDDHTLHSFCMSARFIASRASRPSAGLIGVVVQVVV